MEELQALEAKLIRAHQQLEDATNYVERLEGRKDYVLSKHKINPGLPRFEAEQPRKEQQIILFDDGNCSKTFSDGQVQEIKNALTIICLNGDLLLSQKEGLSAEGKERVEIIKRQVWRIDGILSQKEKN